MSNNNMTATEKLEAIRNLTNAMLTALDSKPLDPPMPWMIQGTAEEHAATIAGQCANLAAEVIKLVADRAITIQPN